MGSPTLGAEAPWCTQSDIPARYSTFVTEAQAQQPSLITASIQMASDLLFEKTARRWGGAVSNVLVRPMARRINDGSPRPIYGMSGTGSLFGYFGGIANAPWIAAWGYATCVADVHRGGGCMLVPEMTLGIFPLTSIINVTIDGVSYPGPNGAPGCTYRIDDYHYLVRTDQQLWPGCQDVTLDLSQPNTWSVTFNGGTGPPIAGVKAAGHLAGEIIAAFINTSDSLLSPRAKQATRNGLTVGYVDPEEIFGSNMTGIPTVDLFIKTYNPMGLTRRATISSVDRPRPARRAGTG